MRYDAPMLIAISGYATSGKDTIADRLCDVHGYRRLAFADLLRKCLEALNPILDMEMEWDVLVPVRYNDALERYGYHASKEMYPEFRESLQRMGTDVGRKLLDDNIWVDATMASLEPGVDYVLTDARFPNETEAVIQKGGKVLRVERTNVGPANDHPSEISLDDWDFDEIIDNCGTIEDLNDKVDRFIKSL